MTNPGGKTYFFTIKSKNSRLVKCGKMAINEYTDYCRLCQSNIGTIPINNEDNELLKKITNITKIEMSNNTKMPPNICTSCQQKVVDIQHFIDMVKKIDEHLQYLGRLENSKGIIPNTDCANENDTEEIHKCEECLCTFTEKRALEDHSMVTHSGMAELGTPNEYTCSICSETYQNSSDYTNHKKLFCKAVSEIVRIKKIQKHGNITMSMIKKLKRKQRARSRNKKNVSDDLVDEDVSNNDEAENSNTHQTYPCIDEECTKTFSSQYSLKIHQLNHEGNPRPFLCVTCGKDFTTRNSLTCHEKTHLAIKGYKCELCDVDFSVRSNLRAHIRKYHEGIRFQCSQCTKQFFSKCSLERHEKLHTGIKEYKCEHCKAEFYTNKELANHQKYHQGLKPHKCQECFKSFFERHHLIVHLRSHSGERPYMCDFPGCGKSFVESQKVKRHYKAKHIGK
ncbi:unnamed protein product [Phaedon cochleariae]|uniref:Zinc finger protein n=1 Tax=Phaedon cochleariae TaxID=80249 RepID=A0A9P0DSV0_PHACE|nr:unnamed protein product [Phaedon cochleariae]